MTALDDLAARAHLGIKRGLENSEALLEALGHPERSAPVVLVAGTNGKGSTSALVASVLKAAKYRVGWATSPHLVSVRERIRIDGRALSEAKLETFLDEALEAEARLGLACTYFELILAATWLAFRKARVDLAVVEVGLGGRWDATNACRPMLSVLTTVGLDHMALLGDTREAIAREKLCIAREGRPLVLGPGLDLAWIEPLLECAPELRPAKALEGAWVRWRYSQVAGFNLPLAGAHQVQNLATALETVAALRGCGFPVPPAALAKGIAATQWPGRLWSPPDLPLLTLDGAHNPQGVEALVNHLLACGWAGDLFFGAMADKDVRGVATQLARLPIATLHFVRGRDPRYATFEALGEAFGYPAKGMTLEEAARHLKTTPTPSLVTGSLYLLGDLLSQWGFTADTL